MRALLHRYFDSLVRRSHRAAIFCRPRDQRPCHENLRTRGLAVDAEWRFDSFHGLASGIRFSERSLGALLRIDDDLSFGDWLADASSAREFLGCVDAPENQISGTRIHSR